MVEYWGNRLLWLVVIVVLLLIYTHRNYDVTNYVQTRADRSRGQEEYQINDVGDNREQYDVTSSWTEDSEQRASEDFETALEETAVNGVIVMAVISINVIDMTMNFYTSSIAKFNINNLIYISTDHESCEFVMDRRSDVNIRCFVFKEDSEKVSVSRYGKSGVFARRTNMKPAAALVAIRLGYKVLVTDVDVIFFRDPIQYVSSICENHNCDFAIQKDIQEYNTGFLYARPTTTSIRILTRTVELSQNMNGHDQVLFNEALDELRTSTQPNIVDLGSYRFPTAKNFFVDHQCPNETRKQEVRIYSRNHRQTIAYLLTRGVPQGSAHWHHRYTNIYSSSENLTIFASKPIY
jgi:hypothetical protein